MIAGVTLDLAVMWANLIAAVAAVVVNLWCFRHSRWEHRWVRPMIAAIAAVFVVSYVWVLLDFPERVLEWSRVMRGASLFAWLFVWSAVPFVSTVASWRYERRTLESIEQALERGDG